MSYRSPLINPRSSREPEEALSDISLPPYPDEAGQYRPASLDDPDFAAEEPDEIPLEPLSELEEHVDEEQDDTASLEAFQSGTLTLQPLFEDSEVIQRRRAMTKQVAAIRKLERMKNDEIEDDEAFNRRVILFKQNHDALNELLEYTVNNRLQPDVLMGLERGMNSLLQRTYLLFVGAIGLMQVQNTASQIFGYFLAGGCIIWIIYNYWLYWTRVGRLNRGEQIMYNENRRPLFFFTLLLAAGEILQCAFFTVYGSGKRVTLVFTNSSTPKPATPDGLDPGLVLGVSFAAAMVIGLALSVFVYCMDYRRVRLSDMSANYMRM